MAKLEDKHKKFIITELACYRRPKQIIKSVEDKFNIKVTNSQVASYDPSTIEGQKLGKKWTDYFNEARDVFRAEQLKIPVSNKNYRLQTIQDLLDKMIDAGNVGKAMELLEQAKNEVEKKGGGDNTPASVNYFQQMNNLTINRLDK
jgi:hypothetical protein